MSRTAQTKIAGQVVEMLTEWAAVEDQEAADLAKAYRELAHAARRSSAPEMQALMMGVRAMLAATSRAAARRTLLLDQMAETIGATTGMIRPVM